MRGRTYVTVQALRRFVTCGYCVDDKSRTCKHVAAYKDIRVRSLIGELIRNGIISVPELDLCTLEQLAPLYALTDCKYNLVRFNLDCFVLVV